VPLAAAALADRETEAAALQLLAELGGAEHSAAVADLARRSPSAETLAATIRALGTWQAQAETTETQRRELGRAIGTIHGASGVLTRWIVTGPLPQAEAQPIVDRLIENPTQHDGPPWHTEYASGVEAKVALTPKEAAEGVAWLAYSDITVPEATDVELLASSSGS
jgi:hypothetical protein